MHWFAIVRNFDVWSSIGYANLYLNDISFRWFILKAMAASIADNIIKTILSASGENTTFDSELFDNAAMLYMNIGLGFSFVYSFMKVIKDMLCACNPSALQNGPLASVVYPSPFGCCYKHPL